MLCHYAECRVLFIIMLSASKGSYTQDTWGGIFAEQCNFDRNISNFSNCQRQAQKQVFTVFLSLKDEKSLVTSTAQIAKVYRRDNPAMSRGRYREFYQCVMPCLHLRRLQHCHRSFQLQLNLPWLLVIDASRIYQLLCCARSRGNFVQLDFSTKMCASVNQFVLRNNLSEIFNLEEIISFSLQLLVQKG